MTSTISRRFSRPALAVAAATAATALAFGQPFVSNAPAAADEADPASDHLILDYGFEDLGDGTTVTDSSGNARNGTLANPGSAALVDRPDGGKALQLSGGEAGSTTSPYVTLPAGVFAGLTATSISTWIKWDGGAPFQWAYCVGKDANSAAFYTPRFEGADVARSSVKPSTGGAEIGASGQSALNTDEWHQITTTINSDRVVYYLDGLEVSRTDVGVDVATALYGESSANSGYLGQPFWTGAHPFFAGTLDDFQVYDTALTPAQVAELAGDAIPDLVDILDTATTARTDVGTAPVLPTGVNASYSDGQNRLAPVTWGPSTHRNTPSEASSP
ncbi:LamG-like jellyroll fold domain-containing protein [Plantibacter sp. M259]|uniref:LamG-like jellyroll fold domain-containing protein n=1 Tax=Plantibacter sp. M259 TaxID=2583822 RepID=UPI00143DE1B1|nr:LamG-like jellyroll fold domain-containing protein [Plantibacter sp. M259]